MALDNLVLPEAPTRHWRAPRVVELSVVVALTVAVVVIGALWGSESGGTMDAPLASSASGVPSNATDINPNIDDAAELAALTVVQSAPLPSQSGSGSAWSEPLLVALPAAFERYQVQRGETLFDVASAAGISVLELLHWNRQLNEDSVLIRGEWLWIPVWDGVSVADQAAKTSSAGKSGRGGG